MRGMSRGFLRLTLFLRLLWHRMRFGSARGLLLTVKICSWLLEGLLAYAVKDTLTRQDEPCHEGRQYTALMYARCLYESVRSCWHCSASSCLRSRILF